MGELTAAHPKCVLRLCGAPLLSWQLAALGAAGIHATRVVVGYKSEAVPHPELHLFNPRWSTANMVRSMLSLGSEISSPVIVSYSDIVYSPQAVVDLLAVDDGLAVCYSSDWLRIWAARFPDPLADAESFAVSQDGFVSDIGRSATDLAAVEGQFMGLLRISPATWKRLATLVAGLAAEAGDGLDTTALLSLAIDSGIRVRAVRYSGPWAEIDSADDLALYETDPRFADLRAMLFSLRPARPIALPL